MIVKLKPQSIWKGRTRVSVPKMRTPFQIEKYEVTRNCGVTQLYQSFEEKSFLFWNFRNGIAIFFDLDSKKFHRISILCRTTNPPRNVFNIFHTILDPLFYANFRNDISCVYNISLWPWSSEINARNKLLRSWKGSFSM